MDACLAGKHDLAVAPIPPVLQVTSVGSGSVTLEWASRAGRRYQLQSTTNLSATSWINEGPPFTGTGGGLATDQLTGSATEKFFRLQLTGN